MLYAGWAAGLVFDARPSTLFCLRQSDVCICCTAPTGERAKSCDEARAKPSNPAPQSAMLRTIMKDHDRDYFERRAAEAREKACHKGGGRDSRVAGHLALAYAALARAKADSEKTSEDA